MTSPDPHQRRRLSFGSIAEQYDRHRPGYPDELVDDVIAYAGAEPGDRALEVGAGTGRATLLFVGRGLQVTAVEPDEEMAVVARARLAEAGLRAEFLHVDFEAAFVPPVPPVPPVPADPPVPPDPPVPAVPPDPPVPADPPDSADPPGDADRPALPEHAFKLLFSATAWHWVDPEQRNRLAARALAPGGALAPFWNRPVWVDNPLRPELDRAYAAVERQLGGWDSAGPMNPRGAPREYRDPAEWLASWFEDPYHDFTDIEARTYRTTVTYTAESYVALLGTHSDHHLLAPGLRDPLLERVAAAINAAGGRFELDYEALLCLARRV